MRQIFTINNVNIDVEYNPNLYTQSDINNLLKYGVKSRTKLDEITSELEIVNYLQVIQQLFYSKNNNIRKTLDISRYVMLSNFCGKTVQDMLYNTFGITVIKHLGNNIYELEGSKKGFRDLSPFL